MLVLAPIRRARATFPPTFDTFSCKIPEFREIIDLREVFVILHNKDAILLPNVSGLFGIGLSE